MNSFKDRIAQYPNRRKLLKVEGQTDVYDILRLDAEGVVSEAGTALDAENMNTILHAAETAVSSAAAANANAFAASETANKASEDVKDIKKTIATSQGTRVKVGGNIVAELDLGSGLSKVATSGNYNDLKDKPNIVTGGRHFEGLPYIGGDGVMECGKFLDFHLSSQDTSDHCVRITAGSGKLSLGGTFEASSFNATSDRRLKKEINPLADHIAQNLMNLPLYSFKYKNGDNSTYVGLIAQDVESAFQENAELLIDKDDNGFLHIKESKLVYLLLDILQKQERRISALEAKK